MSRRRNNYFGEENSQKSNSKSININPEEIGMFFSSVSKNKPLLLASCAIGVSVLGLNFFKGGMLSEDVRAENNMVAQEEAIIKNGVHKNYQYLADDASVVWEKLASYNSYNNGKKVVYLTFDDGPNLTTTPQILDILKKYNVRGTFFVNGQTLERGGERAKKILKDTYLYGNSIANHSYSHDYNLLYPNSTLDLNAFLEDFKKTDNLLKDALGEDFKTNVWRAPGGYRSWKGTEALVEYAKSNGISCIDWNALTKDAEGKSKTPEQLLENAKKDSEGKEMVVLLMHDTKEGTVKGLEKLIKYYHENGYEFRTLA